MRDLLLTGHPWLLCPLYNPQAIPNLTLTQSVYLFIWYPQNSTALVPWDVN